MPKADLYALFGDLKRAGVSVENIGQMLGYSRRHVTRILVELQLISPRTRGLTPSEAFGKLDKPLQQRVLAARVLATRHEP
jgi:hypothetical protein